MGFKSLSYKVQPNRPLSLVLCKLQELVWNIVHFLRCQICTSRSYYQEPYLFLVLSGNTQIWPLETKIRTLSARIFCVGNIKEFYTYVRYYCTMLHWCMLPPCIAMCILICWYINFAQTHSHIIMSESSDCSLNVICWPCPDPGPWCPCLMLPRVIATKLRLTTNNSIIK